jgi:phosphotransferase system  glucose/maltose/N-acetylglucosamine-specific IIC component
MLATQNRYLKPVVPILIALVVALVLLILGSLISGATSGGQSVLNWNDISKWGIGLIAGLILAYILYFQFVEAPIWEVNTRVVVYSAIGAALYGVASWVFNILALPSVSNVSVRPAIVFPVPRGTRSMRRHVARHQEGRGLSALLMAVFDTIQSR